jgi:hypothetical protein
MLKQAEKVVLPGINPGDLFIFWGGSCDPTTWRTDEAIPFANKMGYKGFNPQDPNWHEDINPPRERKAKAEAHLHFFVIDRQTRALVSIVEAIALILKRANLILVIQDMQRGTMIEGQIVDGVELEQINHARRYLRKLAAKFDVPVYPTVKAGLQAIPNHMRRQSSRSTARVTQMLGIKVNALEDEVVKFDMGIDPYNVGQMLESVVQACAIGATGLKTVELHVANIKFLQGQLFHGLIFDGRRAKDWIRIRTPYVLDIAEDSGVKVVLGA